jgi:hypothetical protein
MVAVRLCGQFGSRSKTMKFRGLLPQSQFPEARNDQGI